MNTVSRRAALAMTGALATCAGPVPVMANPDEPRLAALYREAAALEAEVSRMNATPQSDEAWDAFREKRENRFFSKVEALPETPRYAAIRARAVRLLYGDDQELFDDTTTDTRLASQIIRSLTREAA